MRVVALALILTASLMSGAQRNQTPGTGVANPQLRILPPTGAIFVPGQHFDIRIEANQISGPPQEFSIEVNGKDEKREIFGAAEFTTYPGIPLAPNRPAPGVNGGVIRRNWSLDKAGRYEITATLTQADGKNLTAKSTIDVASLTPSQNRAKNIILFIGDGMGVAQRTAARIVSKGVEGGKTQGLLEMDQMEVNGFVMTSSLDALVTDSSPGASAWATGNKSLNNWHGVYPDNNGLVGVTFEMIPPLLRDPEFVRPFLDNPRVENIAELLQRTRRMSTGVVTTVAVTDSTPGAFSSHAFRYAQTAIAEQMLSSGHSVILGGGSKYFLPPKDPLLKNVESARGDGRNILDEFKKAGYTFVSNATQLQALNKPQKLIGFFHAAEMASRFDRMRAKESGASREAVGQFPDQPTLEIMTQQAINVLSQNSNGFFLMVEGGSIDREYHRMDPNRGVFETIELDNAIGVARAWSRQRGNEDTLIIVTADHETAGMALIGVEENDRMSLRSFPNYEDKNLDGFPDDDQPQFGVYFNFPAAYNPPKERDFDLPRNLKDLNPTSSRTPIGGLPAGHTATDVFIGARGPGANLFGTVMDNTDIFFRMLRALGER